MTDSILAFLDNTAFGQLLYTVVGWAAIAFILTAVLVLVVSFAKAILIGVLVAAVVVAVFR